ncbi:MAG: hypothetical protein ACOCYC_02100 [bacterium]
MVKVRHVVWLALMGLLVLTVLAGCGQVLGDLFNFEQPVTPEERIALFEEELNSGDRAGIADHIHPDSSTFYDPQTWNQYFDPDTEFNFKDKVTAVGPDGDEDDFKAAVTTDPVTDPLHEATLVFGMKVDPQENHSHLIRSLQIEKHDLGATFDDPLVVMDPDPEDER